MKGLWGSIIIVGIMAYCSHIPAYLYRASDTQAVKVLRKWHPETNRYHYWIGFCDFHDKLHPYNGIQRKKIEELLPSHNPEHILVLVEDLSSTNDAGKLGCGSYFINSRVGILAGLGSFCKNNNVPAQNVEYRYCRVVALGPVINAIQADPHSFPSARKMTLTHLTQEVEQAYNDLLLGAATSEFKNELTARTGALQKNIEKLKNIPPHQKTIADYLHAHSNAFNRLEIVKNMLTFDGVLIGFKLVDATLKAPAKQKIIAFAGGTHINEAYDILQKVGGYEPIVDSVIAGSADRVAQGINTNSAGGPAKPEPISLELLEHYLKN